MRASAATYRTETTSVIGTLTDCARRIDEAIAELSAGGPLGESDTAHLTLARGHLAKAREAFKAATTSANASLQPLSDYIQRVLPP